MHNNLHPGQLLAERFRVGPLRASDAFGGYWDAVDAHNDSDVSLRVIHSALGLKESDVFAAMARIRDTLDHPAAVTPTEVLQTGSTWVFVSPRIQGESLRDLCHKRPDHVLDPADLESVVVAAVDMFDQAHGRRLVHGGIRPDNIFVDADGAVQFADFGLGGLFAHACLRAENRRVLSAIWPYLSRSVAKGQGPYLTDDIFSFGAVLYVCLTGAHPWQPVKRSWWSKPKVPRAPVLINDRRAHLRSRPAPIPSAWEQVILRCIDRDGFARPQRFSTILQVLAPYLSRPAVPRRAKPAPVPVATSRRLPESNGEARPVVKDSQPVHHQPEPARAAKGTRPPSRARRPSDSLAEEFWAMDPIAGSKEGSVKTPPPEGNRRPARTGKSVAPPRHQSSPFLLRFMVVLLSGGLLGLAIYYGAFEYQRWVSESTEEESSKRGPEALRPAAAGTDNAVAKQAATGMLTVRTIPIGATIQIGDRPPETGPVIAEGLPEGTVTVRVTADGHESREVEAEVVGGSLRNVDVSLERLDEPPPEALPAPPSAAAAPSERQGSQALQQAQVRDPAEAEEPAPAPEESTPPRETDRAQASLAESNGEPEDFKSSVPAPLVPMQEGARDEAEVAPEAAAALSPSEPQAVAVPARDDISDAPSDNPPPGVELSATSPGQSAVDGALAADSGAKAPDAAEPDGEAEIHDRTSAPSWAPTTGAAAKAASEDAPTVVPEESIGAAEEKLAVTPTNELPAVSDASEAETAETVPPATNRDDSDSPDTAAARPNAPAAAASEPESEPERTASPDTSKPGAPPTQPPKLEPVDPERLYALDEVDQKPVLLDRQEPQPPRRFRRQNGVGTVRLDVIIDREGLISAVRVGEATDDRLAQACVAAVRYWRFNPARIQGQPVAVRAVLPFVFK